MSCLCNICFIRTILCHYNTIDTKEESICWILENPNLLLFNNVTNVFPLRKSRVLRSYVLVPPELRKNVATNQFFFSWRDVFLKFLTLS